MTFNLNGQAVAELSGIITGITSVFRATCRVLELGNAGRNTAHAVCAKGLCAWCVVTPTQWGAHLPKRRRCADQACVLTKLYSVRTVTTQKWPLCISQTDGASKQGWFSSFLLVSVTG